MMALLVVAESASLACLGWQRAGLGLLNDLSSCSIDDHNDANVPTYQAVNVQLIISKLAYFCGKEVLFYAVLSRVQLITFCLC